MSLYTFFYKDKLCIIFMQLLVIETLVFPKVFLDGIGSRNFPMK